MSGKVDVKLKAKKPKKPKRGQQLTASATVKLSVGSGGRGTSAGKAGRSTVAKGKAGAGAAKKGGKKRSADTVKRKERRGLQPGLLQRISPRSIIFLILLGVFIAFSIGPVTRNIEATSRLKAEEKKLAEEKKATDALKKEVKEARSLEHIEEEARSQHMVAPGETVYVITSEAEKGEADIQIKNLQSIDEAWGRVQQLLNCKYEKPAEEK